MIREYLRVGGADEEEEDEPLLLPAHTKKDGIDQLDSLASKLNLSENEQQVRVLEKHGRRVVL